MKDIIQKHTHEGKFNLANALLEFEERINGLEEAMIFFSNWYNKTQTVDILVPDNVAKEYNEGKSGIIKLD